MAILDRLVYWNLPGCWPPGRRRLAAHTFRHPSEDGTELDFWWIPGRLGACTLLFFHGNAGNLSFPPVRTERLLALAATGCSILTLDYRGYGRSQGRPFEEGLYRDARSAYQLALQRCKSPENLFIMGRSLGGGVATKIAAEFDHRALILESTFTSIPDVFARWFGPRSRSYVQQSFHNLERIGGLERPLLVIHGTADALVPFSMGRELFEQARCKKSMLTVEGAGHNNVTPRAGRDYRNTIERFIDNNIAKPTQAGLSSV